MSIELVEKYSGKVDEMFEAESKLSLLTCSDFDWDGAHSVAVYRFSTAPMNDYSRSRGADFGDSTEATLSRFGAIRDLSSQVQHMLLKKDRSFIFNIDLMDEDETGRALRAETALARQIREVCIPEIDAYAYGVMVAGAGTTAAAVELTADNVYDYITAASESLDDSQVPDTERAIVCTPAVYRMMKKSPDINLDCDVSAEQRLQGIIAMLDGAAVIKVPAARLPEKFGFMMCHPSATVAPTKLADYGQHDNTPLSSGTICTGRLVYDTFVLENKKAGIYVQPTV